MPPFILRWTALTGAIFLFLMQALAHEARPTNEALYSEWFGTSVHVHPLSLAETNTVIDEVTRDGQTVGWAFKTDAQMPMYPGLMP